MFKSIVILVLALLMTKTTLAADDCDNLPSVSPPRLRANAYVMIEKLQKDVELKIQENRQDLDTSDLENVLETVHCIRSKINETPISCKGDPDVKFKKERLMYVVRNWGFYENIVHYEELASWYSPRYQAGLLIHELSHLCGTEDYEYTTEDDGPPYRKASHEREAREPRPDTIAQKYLPTEMLSKTDISWAENADHYRVWSLLGFCIPGTDCQNHLLKYKEAAGLRGW